MPFSARKMHFFDKNGNLTRCTAQHRMDVKQLFFSGGNFTPIFKAKKLGTVGQKCTSHFDSSQFSPKSAIFGGFEKKVSKNDWKQRHIVYVTQIHSYTWFQTTFGPKISQFWPKTVIFHFSKIHIFGCFWGFGGHIEIPRQVLRYA